MAIMWMELGPFLIRSSFINWQRGPWELMSYNTVKVTYLCQIWCMVKYKPPHKNNVLHSTILFHHVPIFAFKTCQNSNRFARYATFRLFVVIALERDWAGESSSRQKCFPAIFFVCLFFVFPRSSTIQHGRLPVQRRRRKVESPGTFSLAFFSS